MNYDPEDNKWITEALCSRLILENKVPFDLWFEELDTKSRDYAKSICMQCPVNRQCLNRAIEIQANCGIWGGVEFFTSNSEEE